MAVAGGKRPAQRPYFLKAAIVVRFISDCSFPGIIVAFCALLSADLCLQLNLFGNLADPNFQYTINGGFICNPEHIYRAMVRLMFPFTMGLLLSRLGRFISIKGGFGVASLLIIAI